MFGCDKYRNAFSYKTTIKDMERECKNKSGKAMIFFKMLRIKL